MTDQTFGWANLISSFASVLNAVAWPLVAVWFLAVHRTRIAVLLRVVSRKLSSAKKFKVGQVEIEAFEDELKEAVSEAEAQAGEAGLPRAVPERQVHAAETVKRRIRSAQIPELHVRETVRREIYELAAQYEALRVQVQSSPLRTRRMNEIAAGMRTLALAALPLRSELIRSDSVGRRLAAICILQIEPRTRYFRWLVERIKVENQAFVLYQAALAILEFVKKKLYVNPDETREAILDAIRIVSSFPGGTPDQNTLDVLNDAVSAVR